MEQFTYQLKTKVLFGQGKGKEYLKQEMADKGHVVLLAYGTAIKKNGVYEEVLDVLEALGKKVIDFPKIMANPTYAKVLEGAELCKKEQVDYILAVGGGSVIDCAKIVAAAALCETDLWKQQFEEKKLPEECIPMGAIVTAAGTGAEVNWGSIITNEDVMIKDDVFGGLPEFAIYDTNYMLSVPKTQVLAGAFDSLSHIMEIYFGTNDKDNVSCDMCLGLMRNVVRNIRSTLKNLEDPVARGNLIWDSTLAELGILKMGRKTDFQAHMMEHQLGAYTDCSHGQGLAVIHPVYYRHILPYAIDKFADMATFVFEVPKEGKSREELAEAALLELTAFIKECGLPTTFRELPSKVTIDKELLRKVADSVILVKSNPKPMDTEEIYDMFLECL
ncbi:MAG: iron-containing alcohol dehydrogenase [Lachnospiraceae bacterium]|nr:iron-containing alcohol dehydrogenase [Lachnospiraceae bacterium]